MKGRAAATERVYELLGWAVWHAGLLTGLGTNAPGKYPKLERLTGIKAKPPPPEQAEADMNANARAWGAWLKQARHH